MNNNPQYNYSTQPAIPANQGTLPLGTSSQVSPQIEPRKQKRHYPRVPQAQQGGFSPQQQQQQQPYQRQASPFQQPHQSSPYQQPSQLPSFPRQASPFQQTQPTSPYQQQQPRYASPVSQNGYVGHNVGYDQALNGMDQMNLNPSSRQDVSLVGQRALIQDLHEQVKTPSIPSNITATGSPFAQVDACFGHATVNAFPYSNTLLKKSKLPLALILQPYLSTKVEKTQVPVVTDTVVARCSRCKTYINPFVQFTAGALHWKCNMCGIDNEVPQAFDWDVIAQQHTDRYHRAELNYGCVDFIAPAEYTVRPPQPPVYVFVIDVSHQAVQTGMIAVVADAIKSSLDTLPNEDGRTKVAFVTADNAVGFYKLTGDEPEILVVGDLTDMYLPRAASDLIVNLVECRKTIENVLDRMKYMYANTHTPANCLGSALQAARKLLSPTGGKIMCFQASVPNIGEGMIKPKDIANRSSIDAPLNLISSTFYKTFAAECTKSQVCADMFIFGLPQQPTAEVATLNMIPRYTGGQTHFYPGFNAVNEADCVRLKREIMELLSEEIGLEAAMRTRCSQGIVCHAFFGNSTNRIPDIMALPNVPRDQAYCVELAIEEEIQSSHVYFQTALLYTTCFGERRIRVMNLCLPVTKSISEFYSSVDQVAMARTLCHQAIEKGSVGKLRDGRDYLAKRIVEICGAYGKEVMGVSSANAQLTVCRPMSLLPLLILGVLKTDAFQDAPTVHVDMRSQTANLLRTLPTTNWLQLVHANFYSLHNMPHLAGTIDATTQQCIMPPMAHLSSEKLEAHGCYLLENGQSIYLWIGKQAVPQLCKDLFGASSIHEVTSGQIPLLPEIKSPISERVRAIVHHLQTNRQVPYYPTLYIVKEDGEPMLRHRFLSYLLEDRQPTGPTTAGANQQTVSSGMSYFQWLGYIRSKIQP